MLGFHQIAPATATRNVEHSGGCSFGEMRQLGAAIQQSLLHGDRCEDCCRVEQYLTDLWTQPHLVRLSWYGTPRMSSLALDQALAVLGEFAQQIRRAKLPQCAAHQQYVAIVSAFCQQHNRVL